MSNAARFLEAIASADTEGARAHLSAEPSLASARDDEGRSALLLAAYHRNPEMVEILREQLSEMDIFEASAVGDLSRVRDLVGGDRERVDDVSPDGFGPLGLAAFFGYVELVDYLLERGADSAPVSEDGRTPAEMADENGHAEVVKLLA